MVDQYPGSVSALRVRFAPAPTGYLHLGGARTALFNWLVARQQGGEMLLRIEDTDRARSAPEYYEAILDGVRWLGIDWDGEPVHQSERLDLYLGAIDRLLSNAQAYACDCTPEQVQQRAQERGGTPGYDGHCRERSLEPGGGLVVRFRTPDDGETAWDDVIRGKVQFENANLEDFVILRSSGEPTFFVANAVDDADMGITHIIRGEDLINITPKVLQLREALGGGEAPVFAHLPLIVNEQRKKLSKRRDDVWIGNYRDKGFLAEAMANYLATLGWGAPDGVEIRPMSEILELFRLEDVNSASSQFDIKKLEHFNGEYMRQLALDDFTARSEPFLRERGWDPDSVPGLAELMPLVQERVKRLDEVPGYVEWLFVDPVEIQPASWERVFGQGDATPVAVLDDALAAFTDCEWDKDELYEVTAAIGERHGWKLGKTTAPIRVAVMGNHVGPPLFESLVVLGRDRALQRLKDARSRL
jgi:glutamyl-tRNA synthetase